MPKNSKADRARHKAEHPGLYSELASINEKLARIESQNRVIVIKQSAAELELNKLKAENEELSRNLLKVFAISCELFDEPTKLTDLEKIIKDFLINKYRK